jgi:hypothetical protein
MTKIQIDDGKNKVAKTASSSKPAKKIIVTEANNIHSTVQKSTTLSRKYVKKPTVIAVEKIEVAEKKVEKKVVKKAADPAPVKKVKAKKAVAVKATVANKLAEKRLRAEHEQAARAAKLAKERAEKEARLARIRAEKAAEKAAKYAAKRATKTATKKDRAIISASTVIANMQKKEAAEKSATPKMEQKFKKKGNAGRIFLALFCSGATVAALVAFVHFSIPDLSVRVAAIQTGIDAAYPSFVPRSYTLSNVTSDKEGVVVMTFNGPDGAYFTLSEEKSTWDSTALLNNYVKKNYPNDFTTMREQGITIYVRGEKASWVNGGLLYKIDATGKYLTKEQIRNIATSL